MCRHCHLARRADVVLFLLRVCGLWIHWRSCDSLPPDWSILQKFGILQIKIFCKMILNINFLKTNHFTSPMPFFSFGYVSPTVPYPVLSLSWFQKFVHSAPKWPTSLAIVCLWLIGCNDQPVHCEFV